MGKRKDYSLNMVPGRADILQIPARNDWIVKCGTAKYDLSRWRKHSSTCKPADRDALILAMCAALNRMTRFASPKTIIVTIHGSLPPWFEYLDSRMDAVTGLSSITREVLEGFAAWLLYRPSERTSSGRYAYTTARAIYAQTKSVWLECIASGALSPDCLPDNPFPNSNRAHKSPQPYSRNEMRRLLGALGSDLRHIRNGDFDGEQSDLLMVYLLLVATRTGRNPTPLFEMHRDALQPHPIKPETHALLTTYKRRGNNVSVQSVKLGPRKIEDAMSVTAGVATLIGEVREMTEPLINTAPDEIRDKLWLFESAQVWNKGKIRCINAGNCHHLILRFVARHKLISDETDPDHGENKPFQLTFMRLRKTFASAMWALTRGDLVRTAAALGNQPKVTDTHYLAVTPRMVRNHRFVGYCLEADVRGQSDAPGTIASLARAVGISADEARRILQGKNNTGVGRCSSPFFGKYAPQTEKTACTAFLHCFCCPNQVIMASDLYRLFSFYWLLIRERNILQRNRWHKVYGRVIREIDQVISPRFSKDIVAKAREEARVKPHAMWRDRAMLAGTSDNTTEGANG